MLRSPPGPVTLIEAPSAVATVGRSDAGSAWARLPPMVALLRTIGSPIISAASDTSGHAASRSDDEASSAWVVSAPMRTVPFSRAMPLSPSIRPMSISAAGPASLSFIRGMRLWPPARIFESSLSARSWTASATEPARWYDTFAGYMAQLSFPFSWIARQTFSGVIGMSILSTPKGLSASITAL